MSGACFVGVPLSNGTLVVGVHDARTLDTTVLSYKFKTHALRARRVLDFAGVPTRLYANRPAGAGWYLATSPTPLEEAAIPVTLKRRPGSEALLAMITRDPRPVLTGAIPEGRALTLESVRVGSLLPPPTMTDRLADLPCRACGLPSYTEHGATDTARCQALETLAWAIDANNALLELYGRIPEIRPHVEPLLGRARAMGLHLAERPRLSDSDGCSLCDEDAVVSLEYCEPCGFRHCPACAPCSAMLNHAPTGARAE